MYREKLRHAFLPAIRKMYGDEKFYFQQDGAPAMFTHVTESNPYMATARTNY